MVMWYDRRRSLGAEPDKVDDFEYAECVDNEENDKPFLLSVARRVPESKAF